MWNRKLSITICIIFITNIILNSQSITIGFGPIYTLTNQSTRMINSTNDFQNTASQSKINYEQYYRGRKYSIFSSLSKCNPLIPINDSVGIPIKLSHNIRNIPSGIRDRLNEKNNIFFLKQYLWVLLVVA